MKGAKSYVIGRSAGPPTSWTHEAVALKALAMVSGLEWHAVLVSSSRGDERRPKRLERPRHEDRALSER